MSRPVHSWPSSCVLFEVVGSLAQQSPPARHQRQQTMTQQALTRWFKTAPSPSNSQPRALRDVASSVGRPGPRHAAWTPRLPRSTRRTIRARAPAAWRLRARCPRASTGERGRSLVEEEARAQPQLQTEAIAALKETERSCALGAPYVILTPRSPTIRSCGRRPAPSFLHPARATCPRL